ncbi:TM2 domain-containing protein [Planctomonas sp. JC2975]|uniref:TM2 domain-containing protein n=1 Tax=Planctomonas sp. JC2975 TaxID=2729626 RepID=UPI0014735E01|nr:TM2 domain-containing protein [Planctomonas sp. JC2975]NNC10711.1 TM2 domain-containing protein [Planctomonas sp. JC2975]
MSNETPSPQATPPAPTTVYVNATPTGAYGPPLPPRNAATAYLLVLFTLIGVAGIQHFYLGKIGRGILWLLTFGIFGIGTIVDLFTLPSQTKTVNARRAAGIR